MPLTRVDDGPAFRPDADARALGVPRVAALTEPGGAADGPARARARTAAHVARVGAPPTGGKMPPRVGLVPRTASDPRPVAPEDGDTPVARETATALEGRSRWLAGDPVGARAVLEPRVGAMVHPAPRCWALATLALAVAAGEPERAVRLARHARRLAGRADATWLDAVLAHQALADALRRRGALVEARQALDRAAARTTAARATPHHVLTLVLEAELALDLADRPAASRAARAARGLLGAHPHGVLLERLAAAERSARGADGDLRGSAPSPAELRLLVLLPTELTRREIGAELFVTVDTVKTHLRRLYRRLGVETRAEAVAVARSRGLLPPS